MVKKIRSQKGLTLIEVIVVIAVIGILLLPVWQIFSTNNTLTKKERERSEAKNIGVMIQDYIHNELKMASTVNYSNLLPPITTDSQELYLSATRGLVHKVTSSSEKIIFNKGMLEPYEVDVLFEQPGPGTKNITQLTINVKKNENGTLKTLYKGESSVQSINILKDANKIPVSSGSVVIFMKPY